jgi:OmpA-OmpF porin, OOP family
MGMRGHSAFGLLLLLLLLSMTGPAAAQGDGPNYLGALGNYVIADDARSADDGSGVHFLYGSPFGRNLSLELNGFYQRFEVKDAGDKQHGYGGGLDLRYLAGSQGLGVFALGGLGMLWENFETGEQLSPYFNLGIGMQFGTPALQLRAEARHYAILNSESFPGGNVLYDTRLGLGLIYSHGARALGNDMSADRDRDGVPDHLDACPGTAPGDAVDSRGCTLIALAPSPQPVADSDGDGVPDDADQCPGTPPGTAVSAVGCPLDEDRDGVIDSADLCLGSPPGFRVDATGCVTEGQTVIVLKSVDFEFDSAKLTRDARVTLDRVARGLRNQPDLRLAIVGHTDSLGTEAYNQHLSYARALSVRNFLVDIGIDGNRLQPKGLGESRPIASNDSDQGRAQNRRVEFEVLGK